MQMIDYRISIPNMSFLYKYSLAHSKSEVGALKLEGKKKRDTMKIIKITKNYTWKQTKKEKKGKSSTSPKVKLISCGPPT